MLFTRNGIFCSTLLLGLTAAPAICFAQLQPPPPMQPTQPATQPGMQPTQPGQPAQPGQFGQPTTQPSTQPTQQPGGLAPPPAMNQPPGSAPITNDPAFNQQTDTNNRLDESERKDSGRNFELFYIDGQIGGSYINMKQFSSETLAVENASAGGPSFGIGAGFRFVIAVLGARLRHHALSSFNMWQINAEAGLKIPIGAADILFGLHGGYSFVGRLGDAGQATNTNVPSATDAVAIRGFNGGLDIAFDYYVSPLFSVGAGVLADFLYLTRPPVDKPAGFDQLPADAQNQINNDPLYQKSGTSAGLQLAGGLRLGLHFGL